jgi:hypothetical protein
MSSHYIDNSKFLAEIIAYKKEVKKALAEGKKKPGVSNYIGKCFLDIANNLAKKPNFTNYAFKDEMIGDGIENCIQYVENFDPKKSSNPFAFFTQIIFYAFLRRIQREKKQLYVKMRCFEENDPTGKFRNWLKDSFEEDRNPFKDIMSLDEPPVKSAKKQTVKKSRKSKKGEPLDAFMEEKS